MKRVIIPIENPASGVFLARCHGCGVRSMPYRTAGRARGHAEEEGWAVGLVRAEGAGERRVAVALCPACRRST